MVRIGGEAREERREGKGVVRIGGEVKEGEEVREGGEVRGEGR